MTILPRGPALVCISDASYPCSQCIWGYRKPVFGVEVFSSLVWAHQLLQKCAIEIDSRRFSAAGAFRPPRRRALLRIGVARGGGWGEGVRWVGGSGWRQRASERGWEREGATRWCEWVSLSASASAEWVRVCPKMAAGASVGGSRRCWWMRPGPRRPPRAASVEAPQQQQRHVPAQRHRWELFRPQRVFCGDHWGHCCPRGPPPGCLRGVF